MRLGDDGEGGASSGGVGGQGGGESSGDTWGGSGGSNGTESNLPPPMTVGDEQSYGAGSPGADAFHLDANGKIDGVDGPDGQEVQTDTEIEGQAQADATDRRNQGDRPPEGGEGSSVTSQSSTPTSANDSPPLGANQTGEGNLSYEQQVRIVNGDTSTNEHIGLANTHPDAIRGEGTPNETYIDAKEYPAGATNQSVFDLQSEAEIPSDGQLYQSTRGRQLLNYASVYQDTFTPFEYWFQEAPSQEVINTIDRFGGTVVIWPGFR